MTAKKKNQIGEKRYAMMNNTAIVISEENHGILAIADRYESAIDFLFNDHWITSNCDIWDGNEWIVITEYFNTYSMLDIKHELKTKYNIDTFNDLLDQGFYLSEEEIYTS